MQAIDTIVKYQSQNMYLLLQSTMSPMNDSPNNLLFKYTYTLTLACNAMQQQRQALDYLD